MPETDADQDSHVRFMGITPATRRLLAAFWPTVEAALPDILDAFYRHVMTEPELAKLFTGDLKRVKTAQGTHWQRLFCGSFDAAYFDSVRTIGLIHNRVGLAPRWYIGGYNFVFARLAGLAVRTHRWSPARLEALLAALSSAVMLDMDIAITVYQDAMLAERLRRGQAPAELTHSFEATAVELVNIVSTAAAELA